MSLLGCNFKASEVNMGEVSFDSTSTIKGMIFQFLVALERCFEMQEGQSVYIERFGDVSVIGESERLLPTCWYIRISARKVSPWLKYILTE